MYMYQGDKLEKLISQQLFSFYFEFTITTDVFIWKFSTRDTILSKNENIFNVAASFIFTLRVILEL